MELLIITNPARTRASVFNAREHGAVPPSESARVIGPGESHLGMTYDEWLARLGTAVPLAPQPDASPAPSAEPNVRIGAVLDDGFQLIRRGSLPLLLFAALAQVPPTLLGMTMPHTRFLPALLLWLAPIWMWGSLVQATFIHALSQAYHGDPPDLRLAARTALGRAGALVVAGVMVSALVWGGMMLFVFPGLFLLCRYFAVGAVVVLEGQDPWKALGRSGRLGEGAGLKIFATFALLQAMAYLVHFGIRYLPAADGLLAYAPMAATIAANTFMALLTAAVVTAFYYALRVAKEGYDLELLTEQLGDAEPVPATA